MVYNVDRAFLFLMGKCRVTIEHKKNKKYLTTKVTKEHIRNTKI